MSLQPMESKTMEMVAVALSEEYGVKVISSGRRAHTTYPADGKKPTITIPAVDTDDENYLVLIRGYIDHEVGHVRFTQHDELLAAIDAERDATGAMKIISHIYEDVYVERLMGECFWGCGRNIRKLVSLVFNRRRPAPVAAGRVLEEAGGDAKGAHGMAHHIWTAISHYILYRVRQDAAGELKALLPAYREPVDVLAPGLTARLESVLSRVAAEGTDTRANVALAKETLEVITGYFSQKQDQRRPGGTERGTDRPQDAVMAQLKWVLTYGGATADSVDISKSAVSLVENVMKRVEKIGHGNWVARQREYKGQYWKDRLSPLTDEERNEALQAAAMLDAQVHSLLQTHVMNRAGSARTGRLNTHVLHRLSVGNGNVFRKTVDKQGINTEIVITVDMSGSMAKNDKALMASKALYAVIYSLRKIPGVRSGVIGFFDDSMLDILRPSDRVTPWMKIKADGGTLCGEALKYAMQNFTRSPDSRKIVLMLTDGDSDNAPYFEEVIVRAQRSGIEFLGIGIMDDAITQYLRNDECCVIEDLRQLAPEMFRMLRGKLLGVVV